MTQLDIGLSMSKEQSRDNAAVAFAMMRRFTRFCSFFFIHTYSPATRKQEREGRGGTGGLWGGESGEERERQVINWLTGTISRTDDCVRLLNI